MSQFVNHALKLSLSRDEQAAQAFVSALRGHVLNTMASDLKRHWERTVAPRLPTPPRDGVAVRRALEDDLTFRFYSGARVAAQEMVWESVRVPLARQAGAINARIAALAQTAGTGGTLELDPALPVPDNVTALDVHFMPGCYHGEHGPDDASGGALYDNGLSVFSFGLMGHNLDDIGSSVTTWLAHSQPAFQPRRILDLGCSIGHQTLPWARTYPDAEVIGIDVGAPVLRYAHGRACAQGVPAHFKQRDARATGFAGASFDLVFSSMFLHELPLRDIHAVFAEARRLLRPGGLMLHYELPPNSAMSTYDGFYLDWDSWFNNEPWYKAYRDQEPAALCAQAGFDAAGFFQTVVPSLQWYGRDAVVAAARGRTHDVADDHTGRLADGVQWFIFGNWA